MENKFSKNTFSHEVEETIDIKKFLFKIIINWYWFALTIVLGLSIAFFINKYTDPVFSVNASILVKDKDNSGLNGIIQQLGLYNRFQRKKVENEIGILQSYTLTRRAIDKLDFGISYYAIGRIREPEVYKTSPFFIVLDTTQLNKTGVPIFVTITKQGYKISYNNETPILLHNGDSLSNDLFHFSIYAREDVSDSSSQKKDVVEEYYFTINDINSVTNLYKSKLKIETSDKKSSILLLNISGKVPQKEVDFLNMLCDQYIQRGLDEKNESSIKTIKFIDEQLLGITDSLKNAENKLQSFKENNRTMNLSSEGQLLFKKLEDLQKQKSQIIIQHKYYQYISEYIKSKNDVKDIVAPSVMGINDPVLSSLVLQLNTLTSEKESMSYGSTENNPAISMYNNKIENLKNTLIENIQNLINTSKITMESIEKDITALDKSIMKLPITEKNLINIKREFTLNDNIYTYLLQKRAETGIAKAANSSENKILDYAMTENAAIIAPKKKLNYIIAFILALLIPIIIIVILDFFDNKIHERKDIENKSNIPIIGEVEHNSKQSNLVVHEYPRASITESFRKLRTNLKYALAVQKKDSYVISITSTISGEGKSFTAMNTASILAALGKKTVILGLDLRKPSLHHYFDIENKTGVTEYLVGESSLQEITNSTPIENLSIILSGSIPPNPAELIEMPKMQQLITDLKEQFEYIILDTPPIALVTDALLLSKFTDINLYVIRQNYSNKSVLDFINEITEKHKLNINIIINDINISGYYSYKYNYNYKYGGSYYSNNYYDEEFKLPFILRLYKKYIHK